MKKTISILVCILFLSSGCTYTQKTVAGGIMMGVGGAVAAPSAYSYTTYEDAESISGGYVQFSSSKDLALAGIASGSVIFLTGFVFLMMGLTERKNLQASKFVPEKVEPLKLQVICHKPQVKCFDECHTKTYCQMRYDILKEKELK